ncbi:MAG TPA: hypothetical protein VLB04_02670 [Methanotrichaceae archaeon]|nr:hypothetical protein [Methanotrichaceae archaeon]
MITLNKLLLGVGLVVLLVALARTGSAQPMPEDPGMEQREMVELGPAEDMGVERAGAPPTGVPVGMLISEQGVALKGNKTYALRIIVECLTPMEPRRVQKLLASNKSLEEIREAIGSEHGEAIYRGNMLLDDRVYPLMNIRIAPFTDNISILEADVSKPNQDPALINEIVVVGHIRMTIEPSDGGNTGKGELSMNDNRYSGTHAIRINIVTPCGKSMAWEWDNGDVQEAPRYPLRPPSDKED